MADHPTPPPSDASADGPTPGRRGFLAATGTAAMAAGVAVSYGACGAMSARYLYPAHRRAEEWLYVTQLARLQPGSSVAWRLPTGERVTVARVGAGNDPDADFVALSSTCPHLGCQVHWQGPQERFFCPCHNGTFDAEGRGTGGPPGEAGQSLPRYRLRIVDGLLYILAPTDGLTVARAGGISRPGHDACLERDGDGGPGADPVDDTDGAAGEGRPA